MTELYTEVGYGSINKYGEQLCGDNVKIIGGGTGDCVVVLADGLGSGVKANILSTLTSTIISTMISNSLSIEDCVSTIASTLPVCGIRKIAYSTFTIIRIKDNQTAEIIRYDNPPVILLREGKPHDYHETCMQIEEKLIYKAHIALQENDTFIALSDGAIYAGVGKTLNFGWELEDIKIFLQGVYSKEYSAKTLANMLLEQCNELYGGEPGDDTTVCALKIRKRKPVSLVIGPPADKADDEKMMHLFFSKSGKHVVCGGTTSMIAARYLGKEVEVGFPEYIDPDIPPIAHIDGVDLVTEGVVTITQVLEYAKDYLADSYRQFAWRDKQDGASKIARLLFEEATDINFYVGTVANPAHLNPDLPINFNIKMNLIRELSQALEDMGKNIKVSYF